MGIAVDVRQPQYVWVSVSATLRVPEGSDATLCEAVSRQAERELYRYLSPLVGGPRGGGWPFGRDLSVSELYGLLQRVRSVEFVEDVRLAIAEPGGAGERQSTSTRLVVPPHALVCSGQHQVRALPRVDE